MSIPLSSLCVATALANQEGRILTYNDLFRDLVHSQSNTTNESDAAQAEQTQQNLWELVQEESPPDIDMSSGTWNKTFQLSQGDKVPNKWVSAHISLYDDNNNNENNSNIEYTYLIQIQDMDAGLRAKDQFSAILDTTFDGFWDYHIPKDYEYMSPRFWEMFGYEAHEKQHKPSEWMDMVHPQDFQASMVDLQAHFDSHGQVPYQRETRYKHKNGSWVWVLCRGKVIEWDDTTGAPLRMIGTHTDITESKLKAIQERELYEKLSQEQQRIVVAKEELRKFVQHVNAPVFGTDTNGIINTWNDCLEQITQIPATSMIGQPLSTSCLAQAQDMVQAALDGKQQTNAVLNIRNISNSSEVKQDDEDNEDDDNDNSESRDLKLLVNTTTRRNITDGKVLGCFCFGLNLTEIQWAKEKLVRVEERYKAEQQLHEFVAHEVRNPLAAAIAATQFLQENIVVMNQQQQQQQPNGNGSLNHLYNVSMTMEEDIHTVADSLDYIHQLLTSMLDLNKFLEKGNVQLSPRHAHLKRDILDPVMSLYKYRATNLQLTAQTWFRDPTQGLKVLTHGQDLKFNVDVMRLKQVVINLVSNAVKFTKEGFVRIQVGRFLEDEHHPNRLTIVVEDSGPGVPENKRSLLFEKYVQLSTQVQGSGIGLALTKLLVRAMNGTIELDGTYNSGLPGNPGSRFVVQLDLGSSSGGDGSAEGQIGNGDTTVTTNSISLVNLGQNAQTPTNQELHSSAAPSRASSVNNSHSVSVSSFFVSDAHPQLVPQQPTNALSSPQSDEIVPPPRLSLEETIDSIQEQQHHQQRVLPPPVSSSPSTAHKANHRTRNGPHSNKITANLRVLVVDDDQMIRKLLTRRLNKIDPSMIIETADSGEAAIAKIRAEGSTNFDLVVMDHFMPLCGGQMTGTETIRAIRPLVPRGVIVGSSGNDMSKEHADAGADLFWLKPVPKDDVLLDDLRDAFEFKRLSNAVSR